MNSNCVALESIVTIKGGKRLPIGSSLQALPSKHPYIRVRDMGSRLLQDEGLEYVPEDVFPSIKRYIVNENDLIISIVGTVGNISFIDSRFDNASLTENAAKLTGLGREDAIYLYYFLISQTGQQEIRNGTVGAVQAKLPLYNIQKIPVPWPANSTRRSIANILCTLDDKIELNRRMNGTLEAMARALFQSWFTDFDPVRRNAAGGEFRPEDAQFPDSFEDSELGAIPAGWRAVTLGDVSKNASVTFDFKRTHEVIFINTGDVLEGDFLHSSRSSHVGLPGQAKKSIRPDDILFSEIRPANKRYAYVDFDSSDYVVSTKFMIIRASAEIHPRLLYRILTANETLAEFQLQAESRSGTFPQITFDSISHLPIVLPPMEIQIAFQRAVESIDARIKLNKEESRTLANLRDTLLPKLLSGELNS